MMRAVGSPAGPDSPTASSARREEVVAFLKTLGDKDGDVREASLEVAKKNALCGHGAVLIGPCITMLEDATLKEGLRSHLLSLVCHVAESKTELSAEVTVAIVERCASFMRDGPPAKPPQTQRAAAEALVAVASRDFMGVVAEVLDLLDPSKTPSVDMFWILEQLSERFPSRIAAQLPQVLSKLLPILGNVKTEPLKMAVCKAFAQFAQCLHEVRWIEEGATGEVESGEEGLPSTLLGDVKLLLKPGIDLFVGSWLIQRETRAVKPALLETVGAMLHSLDSDLVELHFKNVLVQMLAACKSTHKDAVWAFKGLLDLLQALQKVGMQNQLLDALTIASILNTFLPIAASDVNYEAKDSARMQADIKIRQYMLRSTEIVFRLTPHEGCLYVLKTIETKGNPKLKIGLMDVVRHVLTHVSDVFEVDQQNLLMSSMKVFVSGTLMNAQYFSGMLQQEATRILDQKILQTILALATSGFLVHEGGETLIFFILKHCAFSWTEERGQLKKRTPKLLIHMKPLMHMCERNLVLMSTSINGLENVLFPFMLDRACLVENLGCFSTVAHCTTELAKRIGGRENLTAYVRDMATKGSIPSAHEIIAKTFVLLFAPRCQKDMQTNGLELLSVMGSYLTGGEDESSAFSASLQKLLGILEDSKANSGLDLDADIWQTKITEIFSHVFVGKDAAWSILVCDEIVLLLKHFRKAPIDESASLVSSCINLIGVCLQCTQNRDYVRETLQLVYTTADFGTPEEQQAFASCCGKVGAAHLDVALDKIRLCTTTNEDTQKKSSFGSFFSFSSSQGGSAKGSKAAKRVDETTMATAALAYGYCASYANVELLSSRLQTHVVSNLTGDLSEMKTLGGILAYSQAIVRIAAAVQSANEKGTTVKLSELSSLFMCILKQVEVTSSHLQKGEGKAKISAATSNKSESPLNVAGVQFKAIVSLLGLDGASDVTEEIKQSLLTISIDLAGSVTSERLDPIEVEDSINALRHTFICLLESQSGKEADYCAFCTLMLHKLLIKMSSISHPKGREHIIYLILCVVQHFKDRSAELRVTNRAALKLGITVSRLLARCCDSDGQIRAMAYIAVENVMAIASACSGGKHDDAVSAFRRTKKALPRPIQEDSTEATLDNLKTIIPCVDGALEDIEVVELVCDIEHLINDVTESVSLGAGYATNEFVCSRAEGLGAHCGLVAKSILKVILIIHGRECSHEFRYGMLQTLNTFVCKLANHTGVIFDQVLAFIHSHMASPVVTVIIDTFLERADITAAFTSHVLGKLSVQKMENLIKAAQTETSHEGLMRADLAGVTAMARIFESQVLASASASSPSPSPSSSAEEGRGDNKGIKATLRKEVFVPLVCNVLMLMGHYETNGWDTSLQGACECMAKMFASFGMREAANRIQDVQDWLPEHQSFINNVGLLAALACKDDPATQQEVVDYCSGVLRTQGTSLELSSISHSVIINMVVVATDDVLRSTLTRHLIVYVSDTQVHMDVRKQCMHGLALLTNEQTNAFATEIVSAILTNADNDELCVFSLCALEKEMTKLEKETISPIALNLYNKLREKIEHEKPKVRSAALDAFGQFSIDGFRESLAANEALIERLHSALIALYLRVDDAEAIVRKAAKKAIRKIARLLDEDALATLLDSSDFHPDRKLNFEHYTLELGAVLGSSARLNQYLEACVLYFDHSSGLLAGNAVYIAGCILANCAGKNDGEGGGRGEGGGSVLSSNLSTKIRDATLGLYTKSTKDAFVRRRAAVALGLMLRN